MSEDKMNDVASENGFGQKRTDEVQGEIIPKEGENGKLCAILAYFLLGIIWYFLDEGMKKNEFVKFHVKQSLILALTSIVGSSVLGMIPIIGWLLLPFFGIATLILGVIGIINSLNGEKKQLPVIGLYASQIFKF